MHHLWEKGFHTNVSYATLCDEFVLLYEPDDRTIIKYCGLPPHIVRANRRHMSRMNSRNGTTAQFTYNYTRRVSKKNGLLEKLGFITWNKQLYEETKFKRNETQYRYRLNHEMMPYYTEQVELDVLPQAPSSTESLREESVIQSIPSLCVCNASEVNDGVSVGVDGERVVHGEAYMETNGEREEREYREHAHKSFR